MTSPKRCPMGPSSGSCRTRRASDTIVLIVPVYEREQEGILLQHGRCHRSGTARISANIARPTFRTSRRDFGRSITFGRAIWDIPCFDVGFAKIGVYICYDRHFPEGARALGLNGAEIVFNPSATVAGLSEHLWKIEQPAHAVANGYYIAAINRVGVEAPWNIGEFYGSSYFCNPRGQIIAQASRDKDEVLTADLDLDMIARGPQDLAILPRPAAGSI